PHREPRPPPPPRHHEARALLRRERLRGAAPRAVGGRERPRDRPRRPGRDRLRAHQRLWRGRPRRGLPRRGREPGRPPRPRAPRRRPRTRLPEPHHRSEHGACVMSLVLTLAKRQFRSYFNGPTAYIVLGLVLFVLGFLFWETFFLYDRASVREMFNYLRAILVVATPALTMNLIAEEKRTGT